MNYGFRSFGVVDTSFSFFSGVIFFGVIGIFLWVMIRGISTWNKNNNSPRLTVDAKIVAKRCNTDVQHHNTGGDVTGVHGIHTTTTTTYYVTFEVESGDRMELPVNGSDYGLLAEGDQGRLSFQGTRFLGFERTRFL